MNACLSAAQLIDLVHFLGKDPRSSEGSSGRNNSNSNNNNNNSNNNNSNHYFNHGHATIISQVECADSIMEVYPHILVSFWEKLASLVKEHHHHDGQRKRGDGRRSSSFPNSTSTTADHQSRQEKELDHRLATILSHTIIHAIPQYRPGQLSNIAFAMASIVKDIGSSKYSITGRHWNGNNNMQDMDHIIILHNQLVKSSNATLFWDMTQQQVLSTHMDNFRPKWLVSIAWSLATISDAMRSHHNNYNHRHRYSRDRSGGTSNRNPTTLNVTPFFHALHETLRERRTEFSSKHLGNLAWSTMTCRVANSTSILHDLADEFISRWKKSSSNNEGKEGGKKADGPHSGDEDSIDPMTLCQWASSYAKAGHKNEELFRTIASTAIPMLTAKEFDMRYLANLAYAFALADVSPPTPSSLSSPKMKNDSGCGESPALPSYLTSLFDTIAVASMEKLPSFTTQNFANMVWAYAKVGHSSPTLFDGIAREAMPRLMHFSPQELANLAWAFSKFHHERQPETSSSSSPSSVIFNRIAEEVSTRGLKSFALQGVAMLAHSFATVGQSKNTSVWDAFDEAILTRQRELGYLECSHIARSYAMIGRRSDDVFRSIEVAVLSNLQQFKPSGLSTLAWAYATLGYDVPDLYSAISAKSLQCLDEFNRVDEVLLVLALSRIDLPLTEIRDQIFARATSHLSNYDGLDLFNMLIFYVRAGYKSDSWMQAMANEIISRSSSTFPPDMTVGIAHSYASVGCRNPALFKYLLNISVNKLEELEPKEVASLAWSFATMEFFDRKFFGALADSCDGRWNEFDAASLATLAWAYATAMEDRPELFEGIKDAAVDRVDDFSAQGISMLLWACATAGYSDQKLFRSFEETAEMLLNECDSQSLANIAWAYTVADFNPGTLFGPSSKFVDIVSEKVDSFNEQGLCQLHQWNIWRKSIRSDSYLPPHIEKQCYDTFRTLPFYSSKLQSDLVSELVSMGIHLEEESCTQSGIRVDALIDLNGEKMAVEVDGPSHFVGRKLTGNSILKHRQVSTVDGISIVSLPYWELNSLETSEDKQQYLRTKLGMWWTQP